jgi:hypothetical protein
MHVVSFVLVRTGTGIPSKMVQLIAQGRCINPANYPTVAFGSRLDINHCHSIVFLAGAVESNHVGHFFWRGGDGISRSAVECRIHGLLSSFAKLLQISLLGIEALSVVEQLKPAEAGERVPWIPLNEDVHFVPLAPGT